MGRAHLALGVAPGGPAAAAAGGRRANAPPRMHGGCRPWASRKSGRSPLFFGRPGPLQERAIKPYPADPGRNASGPLGCLCFRLNKQPSMKKKPRYFQPQISSPTRTSQEQRSSSCSLQSGAVFQWCSLVLFCPVPSFVTSHLALEPVLRASMILVNELQ